MYNEAMLEAGENRRSLAPVQSSTSKGKVAILLAAYNGERFLDEQLQSILRQTHQDWVLVVSDDGSTDGTRALLQGYQQRLGEMRLRVIEGPRRGFVANFMAMAGDTSIQAEYFAFSDQDDIWHHNHLAQALGWLKTIDTAVPALHCGRTRLVRSDGQAFGASPLFPRSPTFGNALVQSLAGGNTMVFNRSARNLLSQTGALPIVAHDWWTYMLVSGAGGVIRYGATPTVDYRQHGGNLIGSNSSLKDRLHRIRRMLAGHFQDWNDLNIAALTQCQDLLNEESRRTLNVFASARHAGLLARLQGVWHSGVHRQTTPGNLGLALAALLGKL